MRKLKVTEMGRLTLGEFRETEKQPIAVVLDHVRSLHNVGSVFRTSDAFCIEEVLLCGITAQPPHPEIHKTALGSEQSVTWSYHNTTLECVEQLRAEGYRIIAIEQIEGSTMLNDFRTEEGAKYALIFGNEVDGVDQAIADIVDGAIEIPQVGIKHSLNVSVSAGVLMWEMFRQLR